MPDYELTGKDDIDPYVEALVLKHNRKDPMAHGGVQLKASPIQIYMVSDHDWETKREDVITNIMEKVKGSGMTAEFDGAFNTFQDDALRCFREHHRPPEGCIDYWDDSKRLGRPTAEGKKAIKVNFKLGKADPHLCQFCPVNTYVTTSIRAKKGMYK